jgi:hypothetical protein
MIGNGVFSDKWLPSTSVWGLAFSEFGEVAVDWAHIIPSAVTAFLASLVECIEALTVILAVGAVLRAGGL